MKILKTTANEVYILDIQDEIKIKGELKINPNLVYNLFIELKENNEGFFYGFSKCNMQPFHLKYMKFNCNNIIFIGEVKDNSELTKAFESFKENVK